MELKETNPSLNETPNKPLAHNHKEPKDKRPEELKQKPLEEISLVSGNIIEWLYNKDFVFDKFIIKTERGNIIVAFPPHLGEELKVGTQNNQEISLKGVLHTTTEGEKVMKFISMKSNDRIIEDIPPIHKPIVDEFIKGGGCISDFQYNKKGDIEGYILDDKYIIKIPPHISNEFKNSLDKGSSIDFTGMKKADKEGEVKAFEYLIVRTKTLSSNGKEFLI